MRPIDTELPVDQQVAWSRNLFGTIADGGTWAIPRSGLIFARHGNTLVLTLRMSHEPDMPLTPRQLHDVQQSDYEIIRRRFVAAGIEVRDNSMEN